MKTLIQTQYKQQIIIKSLKKIIKKNICEMASINPITIKPSFSL